MKRISITHGEVKANKGKVHVYLGMTFDFTEKSKVKIKMDNYFKRIINESPMKIGKNDMDLTTDKSNIFENITAKGWVKKKFKSSILQYQYKGLCPR